MQAQPIDVAQLPLLQPYPLMVGQLFKVGKELGNQHGNSMHAAIGIAGEASELFMSIGRNHMVEECGDIEFYLEALIQNVDGIEAHLQPQLLPVMGLAAVLNALMVSGGELIDAVKKGWVYNKPLDLDAIGTHITMVRHALDCLYSYMGVTQHLILFINQQKLIGPNGRYPLGVYSDAAAQARADKQAEMTTAGNLFDQEEAAAMKAFDQEMAQASASAKLPAQG